MFHRFSTWWRALSVVLLSLAAVTWPSAAQAATTSSFSLIHQDSVAVLNAQGNTHVSMTIALAKGTRSASVTIALYPRIVQRSQIAPVISGAGIGGSPLATSRNAVLECPFTRPATFSIGLFTVRPGRLRSPCFTQAPQLKLGCVGAVCDGVYPLRIDVRTSALDTTEWSLVSIQSTHAVRPLQVVLIERLGPSAVAHSTDLVGAFNEIARHPQAPLTLSGNYVALNQIQQVGTVNGTMRNALARALASPLHQIVSAPPSSIDFGGLDTSGLTSQVTGQLALSASLVKSVTGRYVEGTLLLDGQPSEADLQAVARAKVADVVVPEGALTYPPSTTLNWGAPFHLANVPNMMALTTDSELSSLVSTTSIEPGRRAAIALGTLAFLHFEAPNAPAMRTVVIDAPLESTPASFLNAFLSGFTNDPFAQLASLSPSFNTSLVASNGAPAVRTLLNGAKPARWSSHNVTSITTLIHQVGSFSEAIASAPLADALRVALASSEVVGGTDARQALISAANAKLQRQLGNFSVDPSAITLAGPGTSLPITLISRAPYTVTALVHVITDRLTFPKGSNVVITMDSPTKSLRIPTADHQGSSLTLQVVVTTPDGQVVLARAAIQVRIAGTSIVGYFLSFASLFVLALWWWRTYRRRSKGRHAR